MLPTKQKSAWRSNQSLNFVVKLLKTYVSPNPPNSGGMERNPLSLLLPTLMRHLWQPHVPTPHNYSLFLLFLLLNNFQSYRPLFIIFFSYLLFALTKFINHMQSASYWIYIFGLAKFMNHMRSASCWIYICNTLIIEFSPCPQFVDRLSLVSFTPKIMFDSNHRSS